MILREEPDPKPKYEDFVHLVNVAEKQRRRREVREVRRMAVRFLRKLLARRPCIGCGRVCVVRRFPPMRGHCAACAGGIAS